MPIEDALNMLGIDATKRGPRGGDLTKGVQPVARQSQHNGAMLRDGVPELHRFQKPECAIPGMQKEQPWHRMAAYLMLAGRSNEEIAQVAGVTPQSVCNLKSNVWFQELLAFLSAEQGEDILGFMKGEALKSAQTLVDIRDDPDAPYRVRLSACQTIIEQVVGKPTQKIVSDTTVRHTDPATEMAEIELQLKTLRSRS